MVVVGVESEIDKESRKKDIFLTIQYREVCLDKVLRQVLTDSQKRNIQPLTMMFNCSVKVSLPV